MGTNVAVQAELRTIIDAALRGELTRAQADRANDLGRDATNAVMLAGSARIAELAGHTPGPHTPSGSIPVYPKKSFQNQGTPRPEPRADEQARGQVMEGLEVFTPAFVAEPEATGVAEARRRALDDAAEDAQAAAVGRVGTAGRASGSAGSCSWSGTLAGVVCTTGGTPSASVSTWRLQPCLPRSVGFGPV